MTATLLELTIATPQTGIPSVCPNSFDTVAIDWSYAYAAGLDSTNSTVLARPAMWFTDVSSSHTQHHNAGIASDAQLRGAIFGHHVRIIEESGAPCSIISSRGVARASNEAITHNWALSFDVEHDSTSSQQVQRTRFSSNDLTPGFAEVDLVNSFASASVDKSIRYIKTSLRLPFTSQMAARISGIREMNLDEGLADINAISLSQLVQFLNSASSKLRRPSLMLSPDGDISARWKSGAERELYLHFLRSGEVRFVYIGPNLKHPDKKTGLSGVTSADSVLAELAEQRVRDLVVE